MANLLDVIKAATANIEIIRSGDLAVTNVTSDTRLLEVLRQSPPSLEIARSGVLGVATGLSGELLTTLQVEGGVLSSTHTAPTPISGHRMVTFGLNGELRYASNSLLEDANRVFGMTIGAASSGSSVIIRCLNEITEPSWSWTLDRPIYLGIDGNLTQIAPALPAKFSLVIGFPVSSKTMFVNISNPIILT